MGNKKYCHPLTIADSKSRYLFTAKGHYGEKSKSAKAEFTRVFRKYGLPRQIHTDNGSPFGSTPSIQRFTKLSYWFIDLGIMPVFSDPAHPEQNGRHERMHRDLKAECVSPAAFDMRSQQRKLNAFVREYNNIRPHEALGMETPASVHNFSSRSFPERIPGFNYNPDMKVLKVTQNGAIRWKSYYWVYLTAALKGKYVGIQEINNGIWRIFYKNVFWGYFNENELLTFKKEAYYEIQNCNDYQINCLFRLWPVTSVCAWLVTESSGYIIWPWRCSDSKRIWSGTHWKSLTHMARTER